MSEENLDSVLRAIALRTWELFKQEPFVYVLGAVVVVLLGFLTLGLLGGPLLAGYIELTRRHSRGEDISLQLVFSGMSRFVPCVFTALLIALGVGLGTLLLVLPGLLVALFTLFAFHGIVYTNEHSGGALLGSFRLVKDHFLASLVVMLAVAALNILGGSIFFGPLLTVPLSLIALTVAYEELTAATPPAARVSSGAGVMPGASSATL